MLEHLINGEFHPEVVDATTEVLSFEKADPSTTIDAKVKTAEWLKKLELEDEEIETKAEQESARKSFASLVTGQPVGNTQQALANLKTPAAADCLRLGVCRAGQRTTGLRLGSDFGRSQTSRRQNTPQGARHAG
jgi:hypothetical protein